MVFFEDSEFDGFWVPVCEELGLVGLFVFILVVEGVKTSPSGLALEISI